MPVHDLFDKLALYPNLNVRVSNVYINIQYMQVYGPIFLFYLQLRQGKVLGFFTSRAGRLWLII